jgi:hypothetical protein
MKYKLLVTLAATTALALGCLPRAAAQTVTIATFAQTAPFNEFSYSTGAANTGDATFAASGPVAFFGLACGLPSDPAAKVTLSGFRTGDAAALIGGLLVQPIMVLDMKFTNAAGTFIYLEVSASTGFYTGVSGGQVSFMGGSTAAFDTVNFSSDVPGFASCITTDRAYSLSFVNVLPNPPGFVLNPADIVLADYASHTASWSGLFSTGLALQGCTRTPGYWKTHPCEWPLPFTPGANGTALSTQCALTSNPNEQCACDSVNTILIGTRAYNQCELLCALDRNPQGGNALVILAFQLIAAKLNILSGASPPPGCDIAAADALIGNLNILTDFVPSGGKGNTLGPAMTAAAACLDVYNNGFGGVPHCP